MVKTEEIQSQDGLVISPTKELLTGGHAWDVNRIYQDGTLCSVNNAGTRELYISIVANNIGNDPLLLVDWIKII